MLALLGRVPDKLWGTSWVETAEERAAGESVCVIEARSNQD
jgi:hypothetical protein